jgi:YVTN family beta-propeller protein
MFAYVGSFEGQVWVINRGTNQVTATIPVGSVPREIVFSPDGALAYVTDQGLDVMWVIDTATQTVVGPPISLGGVIGNSGTDIAITPDGTFLYVVNVCGDGPCFAARGTVSIIDTSSETVSKTVPLGYFPNGIAITPNGASAYVANQCGDDLSCASGGSVSVISTATQTATQTIPVGQFDSQYITLTVTPDGRFAYVANTEGNSSGGTVSVIDTKTNTVVGSPIAVGGFPEELAATPDSRFVYVTNRGFSPPVGVSVIDTTTNGVIATVPVFGTGFVAITPTLATFAGTPGKANCHGQSISALAQQYEGLNAAASALGFPSVQALQNAIRAFCAG